MATAFYRAGFEKQLTGTALANSNCGAASGAMLADQSTLGLQNPTPDAFRRLTGDTSGGLYIGQIGSTLNLYGVHTTTYDASDGYTFDAMLTHLKQGRFMVACGDYDQIPLALKGDKAYNGFHAVFFHQVLTTGIVVGDPLNDGRRTGIPNGYVTWPLNVARNYVNKYNAQVAGNSLHACVMDLKRLRARPASPATNIRATATRTGTVIGTFGGTTLIVWGGTVTGESISGNNVWYRVWCSTASRIGYCHSSVVAQV